MHPGKQHTHDQSYRHQGDRSPGLPQQKRRREGIQVDGFLSGTEGLPGGIPNVVGGRAIVARQQGKGNAYAYGHDNGNGDSGNGNGNSGNGNGNGGGSANPPGQSTPITTSLPSTPTSSTQTQNLAPATSPPDSPASATLASPSATGGDNSSPTSNLADQSPPTPTPGSATIGQEAESDLDRESHGGSANHVSAGGHRTSLWTGEGPPPSRTTDTDGSIIVFETGSPTGDKPLPGPLPVSARVGIGLVVVCAVLGIVLACFYFQRKRRRARSHSSSQRWWDSRRRGSIVYGDEKDTNALVQSPREAESTARLVTVVQPATPSALYSQPNAPVSFRNPAQVAEVPSPGRSPSGNRSSLSPSPHPVGRFSIARFSIDTLDSQDSSFYAPLGQHRDLNVNAGNDALGHAHHPSSAVTQNIDIAPLRKPEKAAVDSASSRKWPPKAVSFSDQSSIRSASTGYSAESKQSLSTFNITTVLRPKSSMTISSVSTVDPFLDPALTSTVKARTFGKTSLQSAAADLTHLRGVSSSSSAETDPFAGSLIASSYYGFEEYESVQVPVIGNLSDELSLRRGDAVRIVKVFNDGWAMVERADGSQAAERGFIPVDCLRDSSLLSEGWTYPRRVDSYITSSANIRS